MSALAQPWAEGTKLRLSPSMRLQWEQAQECHVLLYPEGMVQLNTSAAAILELCDGTRDVEAIVADLHAKYPQAGDLSRDVCEFFEVAAAQGWVRAA